MSDVISWPLQGESFLEEAACSRRAGILVPKQSQSVVDLLAMDRRAIGWLGVARMAVMWIVGVLPTQKGTMSEGR